MVHQREMEEWKAARLRDKLVCLQKQEVAWLRRWIRQAPLMLTKYVNQFILKFSHLIDISIAKQPSHAFDSHAMNRNPELHAKEPGPTDLGYEESAAVFVEGGKEPFILPPEFCSKTTDDADSVGISNACTL
jgi:hypothetical protein